MTVSMFEHSEVIGNANVTKVGLKFTNPDDFVKNIFSDMIRSFAKLADDIDREFRRWRALEQAKLDREKDMSKVFVNPHTEVNNDNNEIRYKIKLPYISL